MKNKLRKDFDKGDKVERGSKEKEKGGDMK